MINEKADKTRVDSQVKSCERDSESVRVDLVNCQSQVDAHAKEIERLN